MDCRASVPRHCEGAESDGHAVRDKVEPSALARGNHAFPERPISRQRILAGLNEVNAPCGVGRWNGEIRRISKWNARPTERQKSKTVKRPKQSSQPSSHVFTIHTPCHAEALIPERHYYRLCSASYPL